MLKKFIHFLRLSKRTILDIPRLTWGLIVYFFKKTTPRSAHQSLINLFCLTGGISNNLLSVPISIINRPYKIRSPQGVLGNLTQENLKQITDDLNRDGYYIFENRLPEEMCQKLLEFSYSEPATIRGDVVKKVRREIYHPHNIVAVRYDYDQQTVINQSVVQKLLTDETIISVAQSYLKTKPILDVISMWWHTSFQKEPDSESAQFFHFDMDRIKWLKFFIYLTDVNMESGPHAFVRGSHRNMGIPRPLRSQGYARLSDDDIYAAYNKEDIIHHLAPKGTIIAEDTRGLHKGQHVIQGDRLVLQIQFSNSLFGALYPKCNFQNYANNLKNFISHYPKIYCNYT